MKSLPNVTLISYDNTDDPTRTLRALRYCAILIKFADVVLVCAAMPDGNVNGETIRVVNESGYEAAMQWEVVGLKSFVDTDYALCVSYDGYILNSGAWRDYWLDYDFIGAPWPADFTRHDFPDYRVGNTGFCLKSRAFMHYCAEIGHRREPAMNGDVFTSRLQRKRLEKFGMKYAPLSVAADFAWEFTIDEYPNGRPDAFGFHKIAYGKESFVPILA